MIMHLKVNGAVKHQSILCISNHMHHDRISGTVLKVSNSLPEGNMPTHQNVCNEIQTHNPLVCKRILNHLAKLTK